MNSAALCLCLAAALSEHTKAASSLVDKHGVQVRQAKDLDNTLRRGVREVVAEKRKTLCDLNSQLRARCCELT